MSDVLLLCNELIEEMLVNIQRQIQDESTLMNGDDKWSLLWTRLTRWAGLLNMLQSTVRRAPKADTLFSLWTDQSLFLLLNAVCLPEKQQILIFKPLVWPGRWSKTRPCYVMNVMAVQGVIFPVINVSLCKFIDKSSTSGCHSPYKMCNIWYCINST